jgi:hypothetical protein
MGRQSNPPFDAFDKTFSLRKGEADEFYATVIPRGLSQTPRSCGPLVNTTYYGLPRAMSANGGDDLRRHNCSPLLGNRLSRARGFSGRIPVDRHSAKFGYTNLFNLNADFGAECQVHSDGVRAVHKPDSGYKLQETYEAGTRTPREQACRNFHGVDQSQTDEDNHHWNVTRTPKNIHPRMLRNKNAIAIQPSGPALTSM